MNLMSCHVFSKSKISTVILLCRSALVPYYLSKVFFIVEKEEGKLENIPETYLSKINASLLNDEDILLTSKSAIPLIVKKLKNCDPKICV